MYKFLQACVCIPEDDSYTLYCSTQWVNGCQFAVASVLGIQDNQCVCNSLTYYGNHIVYVYIHTYFLIE